MSYNTRRTGVVVHKGTAGRPSPTTQVNYHQQSNRPAGGNASPQTRSANVGYSTAQQPVTYNSAAQPAYSTPAYTTTPPLPPTQPKTAAQQQQQAPLPPPSTPAAKPQPVTPATTPALKEEPVTPANTPKMDTTPTTTTTENGDSGGAKTPFWKKRPFVKVSNRVKRARQNAKLRRILNPKNALTFLNELRPGTGKFVVREDPGWGYTATVEVDGKTFTGHGLGTSKAKVQASERALKYLLLEQLSKSQQAAAETKEEPKDDEPMDSSEKEQEGDEPKAKKQTPEDEVPWGSLAAFALHKLFTDWQKEGPIEVEVPPPPPPTFPVEKYDEDVGGEEHYFTRRPGPPEFGYRGRGFPPYPNRGGRGYAPYPAPRGPPPPGFGLPPPGRRILPPHAPTAAPFGAPLRPPQIPGGAAPMKKIPEDANQRHPVMLLNQLKPNVIYNESREGEQPRVTFIITINIDGKQYVGRGRNKKEAKKQAAKAALAPMGIIYNEGD